MTITLDSGGMTSVVLGPYPIGTLNGGPGTCTAAVGGGFLTRSHQAQLNFFGGGSTHFFQAGDVVDRL